jgi:hypothetical protein
MVIYTPTGVVLMALIEKVSWNLRPVKHNNIAIMLKFFNVLLECHRYLYLLSF